MEIFDLLKNEKVRIVCEYRWLELSPTGVYRVFERAKYKHAGLIKYRGNDLSIALKTLQESDI